MDKYARQAELADCTPHTLRHSFAKNLVDAGTPLDQVAALLGHEDLNTTRIYTKPSREDLELAVRRVEGVKDSERTRELLKGIDQLVAMSGLTPPTGDESLETLARFYQKLSRKVKHNLKVKA